MTPFVYKRFWTTNANIGENFFIPDASVEDVVVVAQVDGGGFAMLLMTTVNRKELFLD